MVSNICPIKITLCSSFADIFNSPFFMLIKVSSLRMLICILYIFSVLYIKISYVAIN